MSGSGDLKNTRFCITVLLRTFLSREHLRCIKHKLPFKCDHRINAVLMRRFGRNNSSKSPLRPKVNSAPSSPSAKPDGDFSGTVEYADIQQVKKHLSADDNSSKPDVVADTHVIYAELQQNPVPDSSNSSPYATNYIDAVE